MLENLISSKVRARIIKQFFLFPGVEYNAMELARLLGNPYSAVWKELNRLEKLGILSGHPKGNSIAYQVNSSSLITSELRSIVLKTEGVGLLIRNKLNEIGEVKNAFIFGSYASGEADISSDLDLMIIGKVNLMILSPMIADLEKELNRSINYVILSEEEWAEKLSQEEPFATNIESSPKIFLI